MSVERDEWVRTKGVRNRRMIQKKTCLSDRPGFVVTTDELDSIRVS